jgi:hypothetical protein
MVLASLVLADDNRRRRVYLLLEAPERPIRLAGRFWFRTVYQLHLVGLYRPLVELRQLQSIINLQQVIQPIHRYPYLPGELHQLQSMINL